MTAGETLLKISDFPFAYSFIAIILGTVNLDFRNENVVMFVSAAGAFGTFLSITDPLGRLLKFWMKQDIDRFIKKSTMDSNSVVKLESAKQGIETRAIGIEIDKFVSVGYFVIILLMYNTLFVYSETFTENLILKDRTGKIICDINCIRGPGDIISFIAVIIVIIVVTRNWKKLKKNVVTSGIHQIGISSKDVTRSTIENMSRAIEQNDWATAEKWGVVVEEEIQTQKGRKETNLKLVDAVYAPLYQEMSAIETASSNDQGVRSFIPFPHTAWDQVRLSTLFLTLTDEDFRNEIGSLYNLISEYNMLDNQVRVTAEQIIRNRTIDVYGPGDIQVYYFVRTPQGQISAPALWECLISGIHPSQRLGLSSVPQYIQVQFNNLGRSEDRRSQDDFNQFETFWGIVLEDANRNQEIVRKRNLFDEIIEKNAPLKTKVFDKIQHTLTS
ncbi:MAG: hypothetical protein ACREA3_02885 [Nitrosotalea sp.]